MSPVDLVRRMIHSRELQDNRSDTCVQGGVFRVARWRAGEVGRPVVGIVPGINFATHPAPALAYPCENACWIGTVRILPEPESVPSIRC